MPSYYHNYRKSDPGGPAPIIKMQNALDITDVFTFPDIGKPSVDFGGVDIDITRGDDEGFFIFGLGTFGGVSARASLDVSEDQPSGDGAGETVPEEFHEADILL